MSSLSDVIQLLNQGGFAVLAGAFLITVRMMWRKDKRMEETLEELKDAGARQDDSSESLAAMVSVVERNSEAMSSLRAAVDMNTATLTRLNGDLDRRMSEVVAEIRSRRA